MVQMQYVCVLLAAMCGVDGFVVPSVVRVPSLKAVGVAPSVRSVAKRVGVVVGSTAEGLQQATPSGRELAEKLKNVLSEVAPDAAEEFAEGEGESADRFEKLINIKDRGQIFRVEVESIEYIEAAGDYMCIYTGDNSLILRETMKDLERRLDPRKFQRVHRSTIVNLDQVRQVKPHTNGECFLVLESGAEVKVSRSYRDVVARFVH